MISPAMEILLAVAPSAESDLAVKAVAARPWPLNTTVEVTERSGAIIRYRGRLLDGGAQRDSRAGGTSRSAVPSLGWYGGQHVGSKRFCKRRNRGSRRGVGADLVVVGAHRVSTEAEFLHGSVARAVVRFAPCSVEVVRGETAPGAMKILLATDGSQYSQLAARSIAERPWPPGTEVRVLSVADHHVRLYAIVDRRHFDARLMQALEEQAMARAKEAVSSAEQIILKGRLPASVSVVPASSRPQKLILNEAKSWNASLIVLGVHGQIGLTRLLLGSVSEAVATHARCSVEVIRSLG